VPTAIGWEVEQSNANITVTRRLHVDQTSPSRAPAHTATLMLTEPDLGDGAS